MNPKPCTRARTAGIPATAILLASALCPAPAAAEDFTARMLDTGGALPRKNTAYVQIHVERWTTDDEARRRDAEQNDRTPPHVSGSIRTSPWRGRRGAAAVEWRV